MSRTKHTKEPWEAYLQADGTAWIIATKERDHRGIRKMTIARIPLGSDVVDDVDRIVSCVNACAGLDLPDDVETGAIENAVQAMRTLLQAEEFAAGQGVSIGDHMPYSERAELLSAALAKLEGK